MTKAWIFPGNGACGAWGAGAASVLTSYQDMPSRIYGVSSGSLNSFLYSYLGTLKTLEFWNNIERFSDVFKPNYFRLLAADGVFRMNPKLVKQFKHDIKSRLPSIDITTWTMDNETGEADKHEINRGAIAHNASDIAIASCSIPGVVESHCGRSDAGFRLLAPLKQAILDGHDEIILISGRPLAGNVPRPKLHVPMAEAAYQAVDVALSEILRRDINECYYKNTVLGFRNVNLKIIQPQFNEAGPLDFADCKKLLKSGRNHVTNMIQRGLI